MVIEIDWSSFLEMELKKIHLGTLCYGVESKQEVRQHIQTAYNLIISNIDYVFVI